MTTRPAHEWTPLAGQVRRVALEVLRHGPLSRAELAKRVDLSAGSLTRLTRPLVESGLLVETDHGSDDRRPGRPSQPLDIVADSHHFVGIKLTGDVAYGVVTDLRASVVARAEAALNSREPESVCDDVTALVTMLAAHVPSVAAVGISLGGHVRTDGSVHNAPFLNWHDVPIAAMCAPRIGLPVVAANDVAALTEATHWFGEGRRHTNFALVTIGAGIGLGVVAHDLLLDGLQAGLGPITHLPLEPNGPVCELGHRGCAQAMLTIGSIERQHAAATGRGLSYEAILDAAHSGDLPARRIVDDAGRSLGRLLATVFAVASPETLILGGEGARLAAVFPEVVDEHLRIGVEPLAAPPPLVVQPASFYEWARGAAVVAIQSFATGRQELLLPR